ncbi:histidine kinase N-terminal 7TM domain-containing protein [Haloferax sp. YSMS24]|uniref:histidine kinase N-terminal 7TM domain-containing protein n=1 Tax=Haloferax sp. YSMS24 TaxID=3388425 RepID=UPI00398CBE3D
MDGAWQFHPVFLLLVVSVISSGAIAAYSYRSRETTGALALCVIMVSSAWWSASYLVQLLGTTVAWQLWWLRVSYVGVSILPPAWLIFALRYTDSRVTVSRTTAALITAPSVILAALAISNPLHGLVWTTTGVTEMPFVVVGRDFDIGYYAFVAYAYSLVLVGMSLLLRQVVRSRRVLRAQGVAIFVGVGISLGANVHWMMGQSIINYTSIAFSVSGGFFALALFRYRLLDLVPIARDTVVEEMREAYLVLDAERRVVDLNPAARRLLSPPADSIGRHLSAVAPTIADRVDGTDGTERHDTTVVLDADSDGRHRFLEIRASPLADDADATVVTVRDATERQRARRRFQSSIEQASDVVMILDESGKVEYVSPPIEHVTGVEPDEFVGRSCFDLVDDADREMVEQTFARLCEHHDSAERFEIRVSNSETDDVVLEGIGRNLLDEPFVEGVVVNFRDITERTRREQRLARTNERLERFASVVSHDLRNPLNVAVGNLQLARETGDEEHIQTVHRALTRMDTIVQDALQLARHGRLVEETEPVRLGDVASLAWASVVTADATLLVESDATLLADADRLQRLFENLVRNAFEHGGDDISLWVGATDDGFYVEDSGPGIPAERRGDIFEPGVSSNDHGTGLGLVIVAEIVDAHEWDIRVETGRVGGARFVVSGVSVADGVDLSMS